MSMKKKLLGAVTCTALPAVAFAGSGPSNELCQNAIAISVGDVVSGTNQDALIQAVPCVDRDGQPVEEKAVWYTLMGTGNSISLSTCNDGTDFDTRISVYCGGCAVLSCVGTDDDGASFGCPVFSSTLSFCSEEGREYLVQVSGFFEPIFGVFSEGDFVLSVNDAGECGVPDGNCDQDDCLWEQLPWDGEEGQSSESGTAIEESRTADEFCLKEGFVHRIDSIVVEMLTNSEEYDATLQLYHDCNGCPGDLVDCGFFKHPRIVSVEEDVFGDLDLVRFEFNTGPREHIDEYGEIQELPGLWLKGGCYWVSPVGIGDGTGYDRYLWCTSSDEDGEELLGAIPKTQVGELKVGPDFWEQVSETNVGCRNFCFGVAGESCCIVLDNGGPSQDSDGAVDTTNVDCFNADNFLIPPCSLIREICFFSAYIWTNCECERTKVQFLRDECHELGGPAGIELARTPVIDPFLSRPFEADKCVQLTGFGAADGGIDFEGQALALYRVEFHDLDLFVRAGENFWAALEVQGTGSFNERGFWAFNQNCLSPDCTIHISEGVAICPSDDVLDWTGVGKDYSFCVAAREIRLFSPGDDDNATSDCVADMDGDGTADVADLISFLGFWFEGCEE